MRISDWSSDVCSSDLETRAQAGGREDTDTDGLHGLIVLGLRYLPLEPRFADGVLPDAQSDKPRWSDPHRHLPSRPLHGDDCRRTRGTGDSPRSEQLPLSYLRLSVHTTSTTGCQGGRSL